MLLCKLESELLSDVISDASVGQFRESAKFPEHKAKFLCTKLFNLTPEKMPLEATMFILDNSKYSRNGDILPTRFDAQVHVLGKYVDSKLNENPESCVGLMTMGGNKADCLVTLVKEKQEIMGNIGKISLGGELAFLKAVQIAQLALKHRSNKHQAQRIVAIVASPVEERQQELVAFAKTLRRNNIAINIMNLGISY